MLTAARVAARSFPAASARSAASRATCLAATRPNDHVSYKLSQLTSSRSSVQHAAAATRSARFFATHAHKAAHGPTVLVVGGNGALGQAMILTFKNAGWRTVCMDFKENAASEVNIALSADKDWKANLAAAEEKLSEVARARGSKSKKHPVSVAIHCAGSWMGGGADSLLSSVDPMLDINLKSALSTAHLASRFLDESGSGLLLLTGAAAAANQTPTPSMIAYGISKAATHQLATSLAHKEAGLKNATVVCLLPTMIDTPSNRAMSSNPADYASWTPPLEFAALALSFAQQLQPVSSAATKPVVENAHTHAPMQNGGFYVFTTEKGATQVKLLPPIVAAEPI